MHLLFLLKKTNMDIWDLPNSPFACNRWCSALPLHCIPAGFAWYMTDISDISDTQAVFACASIQSNQIYQLVQMRAIFFLVMIDYYHHWDCINTHNWATFEIVFVIFCDQPIEIVGWFPVCVDDPRGHSLITAHGSYSPDWHFCCESWSSSSFTLVMRVRKEVKTALTGDDSGWGEAD